MKLIHLTLDQLSPSRVNVRKRGGKEIADLLPSIRRLGILQPLLVRASADGYEVVAGQRRLAALTALAAEGIANPVPVIVMQDGDDATAIEASLTENIARLPMDEIDQYKAFAVLRGEGLEIAGIIEPVLNAYQGSQFTSIDFTAVLKKADIAISMDGKGAWRDNVFVERLWRSIKYEEVYLHAYKTVPEARAGISRYLAFYNTRRPHSAIALQPPVLLGQRAGQPSPMAPRYRHRLSGGTAGTGKRPPRMPEAVLRGAGRRFRRRFRRRGSSTGTRSSPTACDSSGHAGRGSTHASPR